MNNAVEHHLPLLMKAILGEPLYLYLTIGSEVISLLLIRYNWEIDWPLYYIRKVLQGAQVRYSHVEVDYAMLILAN